MARVMRWDGGISAWAALAGALLLAATASAQESAPSCPMLADGPVLSLQQLVHMSRPELEQLYRQSAPGTIPEGYLRGKAIRWPGSPWTVPMSRAVGVLWHGKIFDGEECMLINQWCCGIRAIRAHVAYGPSWLDGNPSIIMDYQESSRVWNDVRDEIREVAPGLYLGVMYLRKCPQPRFKMYFALQIPCAGAGSAP